MAAVAGSVATAAAVLLGAVWAASADRQGVGGQLEHQARQLEDHETRLRTIERHTEQTAADVRWIRHRMEQTP